MMAVIRSPNRSSRARWTASLGVGLDPVTSGPVQLARRGDFTPDTGSSQLTIKPEPGWAGLLSDRHRCGPVGKPRPEVIEGRVSRD
jgi:hypothetical protein